MNNAAFLSFLGLSLFFSVIIANCQVQNRFIRQEDASKHGVKIRMSNHLPSFEIPSVNVKELLKEDSVERTQGKPFRFGKAVDVDIDFMKVATRSTNQDTTLFFYKVISSNAFSINLIFDDFFLADNASLLIYNFEKSMVYGPIDSRNNPSTHIFWSDLIKGESIVIQLTIVGSSVEDTRIHIDKVIHGYHNTFAGFGESSTCNTDIACPDGNAWRQEGSSVAMLLLAGGQRFCSGVLLNNACQDFTPNILTAFHCVDVEPDGTLTPDEENEVSNWVFRFLYESPSCGGVDDFTYQSINGSTLRSAFQPSDFALLLLDSRPLGDVTYAGWDRANAPGASGTAIHHPNGDIKKISIDSDALTNVAEVTTWVRDVFGNPIVQSPEDTHWQAIFESGTVEPGSSGSPIFDQDHRVVGQLHGDHLNTDNNFCANRRGQYGRFDVSWIGGGTPATQLSIWLTNDPNVTETNTIVIPSISGITPVCSTSDVNFTLNNPPANATVTWQATPSNRFINSSGTGTTATLRAASALVSSNTTLTFTLSTCGVNAQVSKSVWVGKPANASNYDLTVQGSSANPVVLAGGSLYQFNMESVAGASSYMWMLPAGFSFMTGWPNNANIAKIWTPTQGGSYQLRCYPQNSCSPLGSTYQALTINIQGPGDPPPCPDPPCEVPDPLRMYPNPANESVSILLANAGYDPYEMVDSKETETTQIIIYNSLSDPVFEMKASGNTINIPVRHLRDGYYFLHIINREGIIQRKLLIKH